MKEITDKQKRFVDEYLIDLNGKQAAIRAGYSEKTAEVQASRLLSNVKVKEEISKRQLVISAKFELNRETMIKELIEVMNSCKKEGIDGKGVIKDRGNWNKAIDLLNKLGGLYEPQKIEHSGSIDINLQTPGVELNDDTDESEDN